jgi:integrase
MFTGSRPIAIERATWSQLELVKSSSKTYGILTFDGKSGEEKVVIPGFVISVLTSLPTSNTLTGINMPKSFWKKVRVEAGCPDLWIRDWRRTFASIGLSNGFSMDAIGEVLNHKSTQTTKTYAKLFDRSRIDTSLEIAQVLREKLQSS